METAEIVFYGFLSLLIGGTIILLIVAFIIDWYKKTFHYDEWIKEERRRKRRNKRRMMKQAEMDALYDKLHKNDKPDNRPMPEWVLDGSGYF